MYRTLQEMVEDSLPILTALQKLNSRAERFNRELSAKVLYHPGFGELAPFPHPAFRRRKNWVRQLEVAPGWSYSLLLSEKVKDVVILYQIRDRLPVLVRMEVEESYLRKYKLGAETIGKIASFEDILLNESNPRFLNGRVQSLLLSALNRIQLNLHQVQRAKKPAHRPRGYKDHGVLASRESIYRKLGQAEYWQGKEEEQSYHLEQSLLLEKATLLLAKEGQLGNSKLLEEQLAQIEEKLDEVSDASERFQSSQEPDPSFWSTPCGCSLEEAFAKKLERACDDCPSETRRKCYIRRSELLT